MNNQVSTEFGSALKKRVGTTSYNRWLSNLKIQAIHDNKAVFNCPNKFVSEWIKVYFYKDILFILRQITGKELYAEFLVSSEPLGNGLSDPGLSGNRQMSIPGTERRLYGLPFINRDYTFNNFVVGPGNRFAYASALAVTERNPGLYNPLFFYSTEGLGKTHLSSAMGQKILSANPDAKVFYTTAEWFTHEMVQSLRKNDILQFKEKYRKQCDVLLIEDVQFLQGKAKTQQEVFYTLDALIQMGKLVVMTGNSNPREIKDLTDNLKSRMGSGLVVDIQPPDYETKMKIITKKCNEENIAIPEEVADYMARSIKSNVRDLKSALIHLLASSSLLGQEVTLDLAKEALKGFIQKTSVTIDDIQKFIVKQFKLTAGQLESQSRSKTVSYPRQFAFYFCRKYTESTLEVIGRHFNRKHSSVLRSLSKFETSVRSNTGVKDALDYLTRQFEQAYL